MENRQKILVCEDNKATQLLLKKVLENMRYEVLIDTTGGNAFNFIENEDLSMIITDLNMPSINGFEIIEHARKKHQKKYPILVLTNMSFPETESQAMELGADAFIGKPFDLKSFSETVNKLIKKD